MRAGGQEFSVNRRAKKNGGMLALRCPPKPALGSGNFPSPLSSLPVPLLPPQQDRKEPSSAETISRLYVFIFFFTFTYSLVIIPSSDEGFSDCIS